MKYIELYSDDILDAVSVGKFESNFNESNGDYIKVEVFSENSNVSFGTVYSNKLLLKYPDTDNYYLGLYHFHPENPDMGFCTEEEHTTNSITNLQPITVGGSVNEPLNSDTKYKKQFDIFRDNNGEIYIKPNEIFKLFKLSKAKYKIRIYFLRNIKSTLGNILLLNKNNLIENGNFFAGLEATQTGDLDRSIGRNNFVMMDNPGYGQFVLEQNGIGNNIYDMRVTGIELNSYYIFSCWVAWNNMFNGSNNIVSFDNTSNLIGEGLPPQQTTDLAGSWIDNEDADIAEQSRILSSKQLSGVVWYKLFAKVYTDGKANLGSINIKLGSSIDNQSDNPFGRRFFTDLRFEKIENFDTSLTTYIVKLKKEHPSLLTIDVMEDINKSMIGDPLGLNLDFSNMDFGFGFKKGGNIKKGREK